MKNVRLHGKLGKRFVKSADFDVSTPVEAMAALMANYPDIRYYLAKKEQEGVQYGIKSRKTGQFLGSEELGMIMDGGLDIVPAPAGGGLAAIAMSVVTSLISGFIQNQIDKGLKQDDTVLTMQSNSFIFKGKENRYEQGTTVPLGYGRMLVGSSVVSNSINNYDLNAETGGIYTLEVGAYTMLPNYAPWDKFYDEDLGPLKSSALRSVAEGYSELAVSNPNYKALKKTLSGTKFGSNDGIYGSSVITDGHEYSKKIGGGFFGSLTYKVVYNQSVSEAFLTNYSTNGNFTPVAMLSTYPDQDLSKIPPEEKAKLGAMRIFNYSGYEKKLRELVQKAYDLPNWNGPSDTVTQEYVEEKYLRRSAFAVLQSRPRPETIDPNVEPRRYWPIGFSNGEIIEPGGSFGYGDALMVGSRYKSGSKEGGLGWHKFESVSVSKAVDLICEGPIQGFCDPDGNYLEFKDTKSATNKNTQVSSDDDYLRGVFLNDYPVKEVKELSSTQRQAVYNVNEFDIDVSRNPEGEMGSNDQALLESKYQFVAETKQVGGKLFGPHTLDAAAAAAAAGSEIRQWSKKSPFFNKGAYVTHLEEKYKCLRSTNTLFSRLDNFIRSPFDIPHIVVHNAKLLNGGGGYIESGNLYMSTNAFVTDEDDPFAIGEFIANAEYEPGNIVFERAEYLGDDPFGNDDEAQEIANNEPLLLNMEDPDSMGVDVAYWEAGPNAKKVKKYKAGDAYDVGDIVYESQLKVFKVKTAVAEWDATILQAGASASDGKSVEVISLEDEAMFEQASRKEHKGFLAAIAYLDSNTFSPVDVSPNNTQYWVPIFAGSNPDSFTDAEGQPLYHDPTGAGATNPDNLNPVFKKAGGDDLGIAFRPEEEYPISHIITNQLVDQALVSIQIDALSYMYPGDKVEVTYEVGALMLALLGAIVGVGASADIMSEADEADVMSYVAAAMWGGLIGYIIGKALQGNSSFKVGTKIENSGETWPNKLKFRIKYGNEGSPLYETDVCFFGVCTSAYIRDIKIYFPENPLGRTRIIKVCKISRERNPVKEGEQAMRYREQAMFSSVTEISNVKVSYPNSVTIGTRVNAKDMPSMPKRNYNLLLKKVKVPNNYDPVQKVYGEMWDGQFASELKWTDNPAWCLYDLISNNSYGLGRYGMDVNYIDKWTFYRAAKYCDEIIPTGYSPTYKKRDFKSNGGTEILVHRDTYDSEREFSLEFGYPGKKVAIFYKLIDGTEKFITRTISATSSTFSGENRKFQITLTEPIGFSLGEENGAQCCAEIHYPVLENRYRFNAFLTSPQNAFKMINEIAGMFRAFTYWGGGKINFFLDEPKEALLLFGNNNISDQGFSYGSTPRAARTNAIKVKYLDEHNAFKPKIEYVEDREKIIDNGLYEKSLNSLGTSTKTQAHRVAEYEIQAGNLETETINFQTSMPGSYLRPGDVIDVIDNKKTIGRFAGKVLNYDVSGDGKVAYLDIDFPVRTLVDEDDSKTFKTIKLYNISGYDTLDTLNEKAEEGRAISDEEIKSIRAGHLDEFVVGSITNNDTRIEIINNPYSYVSGNFSWAEAVRHARTQGGGVATIANDVDQRFVQTVLPRDNKARAWIGGYYKEQPFPEEFVWLDAQACDFNRIDYYSWATGFPNLPDPITEDNEQTIMTDPYEDYGYPEGFEIAMDNILADNKNFIGVSGSDDKTDHADWITQDGLVRQGYILEKRADDRLLRLNGIDGLTYLLEDDVNMANAKQYRVLNIKEQGNHNYSIEGIEYASGKFQAIENNESLPVPKSPIIYTSKTIDPPGNVVMSYLEEDLENNIPYGLNVSWNHPQEDTVRGYKVQIFDGLELKKTIEVKKKGKSNQEIEYRDFSINEGGSYTARVESMQ